MNVIAVSKVGLTCIQRASLATFGFMKSIIRIFHEHPQWCTLSYVAGCITFLVSLLFRVEAHVGQGRQVMWVTIVLDL